MYFTGFTQKPSHEYRFMKPVCQMNGRLLLAPIPWRQLSCDVNVDRPGANSPRIQRVACLLDGPE